MKADGKVCDQQLLAWKSNTEKHANTQRDRRSRSSGRVLALWFVFRSFGVLTASHTRVYMQGMTRWCELSVFLWQYGATVWSGRPRGREPGRQTRGRAGSTMGGPLRQWGRGVGVTHHLRRQRFVISCLHQHSSPSLKLCAHTNNMSSKGLINHQQAPSDWINLNKSYYNTKPRGISVLRLVQWLIKFIFKKYVFVFCEIPEWIW